MARKLSKLPKWAIKQAGGINKKAWALARRGRPKSRSSPSKKKTNKRRKSVAKKNNPRKPMGIVGKVNAALRGWKLLGAPVAGGLAARGFNAAGGRAALRRAVGYNLSTNEFEMEVAKTSAVHYATAIAVDKGLSLLKVPQMAGRKKILSVVAQYFPEISAVRPLMEGDVNGALNTEMATDHGYWPVQHQDWVTTGGQIRDQFIQGLGARFGLGVVSRFLGPMINKHLPKGVNI